MAEFTASIVTLVNTGLTLSQLLYNLARTLKNAPDELLALANEVTDLNLVMNTAQKALLKGGASRIPADKMTPIFDRANAIYTELQELVDRLNKALSAARRTPARILWLKEKSRAQELHSRLRGFRTEIVSLVSVETLLVSSMTHVDINELRREITAILDSKSHLRATADATQNQITWKNEKATQPDPSSNMVRLPVYESTVFGEPMPFLGVSSPATTLSRPLSSHAASPDVPVHALYMFISSSGPGCGPQLTLAVTRVLRASAESFEYVWTGNIDAVKVLFSGRHATPMDVDDMDGGSYLIYALRSRKHDMSRFIFDMPGTNASLEDHFGESPVDVAWQLVLSRKAEPSFNSWLRSRVADPERLRERNFTTLHKIICGLCRHDLEEELKMSTASINTPDSGGWTPLIWASYCQDWRAIRLLLKYGADPNIANRKRQLALHLACREGIGNSVTDECLTTICALATATENINKQDVYGDTPLMYAGEHDNDPRILETLYSAGASLFETDLTGHTVLHIPIYFDNSRAVETLIRLGADIESRSSGDTPLMKTLICNAHECMRVLCRFGASMSVLDLEGQSILHLAAMHADAKSLEILSAESTSLGQLDPRLTNDKGQTAQELFKKWHLAPADEKREVAWENLLSQIKSAPKAVIRSSTSSSSDSVEIYHDALPEFEPEERVAVIA